MVNATCTYFPGARLKFDGVTDHDAIVGSVVRCSDMTANMVSWFRLAM